MIIKKDYDLKIHACNKINFSSNINEVIKAVLNFLFFYEKISHASKAPKTPKISKSTKSTKRHKDTQTKVRNTNTRISNYFSLGFFLGTFLILVRL